MFLNWLYFNELSFYVQHFPMYRESDAECFEPDEAPADEKNYKFRERWECISRESSEFVSTLSQTLSYYSLRVGYLKAVHTVKE